MKILWISLVCIAFLGMECSQAQILKDLGNRAKQKVASRADNKVDREMDKGLDKIEQGGTNSTPAGQPSDQGPEPSEAEQQAGTPAVATEPMSYTSKYDFVPGEKVVVFEDFAETAMGDFPQGWNTNVTAEVVTLNNSEGKWLKINKEGVFHPEMINELPDNFTLELDLGVNPGWAGTHFAINIAKLDSPADFTDYYHYVNWKGNHAVHMELWPARSAGGEAGSRLQAASTGNYTINNDVSFRTWDNDSKNFGHLALWRQDQRLRVYLNGEKIWDIPRAFETSGSYNAITLAMYGSNYPQDYFVLGNIRLAVGAPDTRNKLLTEGKFVTRGILFDLNSAAIRPESAGAIKDIAAILKENASLKVKIVGHTDSDGDDNSNLSLSQKRAESVKAELVKKYGIPETNLTSEGKGESEPVDSNTTPQGKANNRRVEFVRI